MANFFIPSYEDPSRYQTTTDGGYLRPWKMQVGIGSAEYGVIGLYGGYDRTEPLQIVSNNPGIISFSEAPALPLSPGAWPNADRLITVIGQKGGTTMLEARGQYGPWCSLQIEVTGGYSRPDETGTFVVTNQWDFDFEPDLNPLGYTLPNGVRIPLPPRGAGRLWPRNRATKAKFARSKDEYQNVYYTVLLMPPNHDGRAVQKFLIGQAAESGLSKVGAFMFRGVVGPALAGVATIFVPGETASIVIWDAKCTEGNVYGASVGF
jgi:hypothetical protein